MSDVFTNDSQDIDDIKSLEHFIEENISAFSKLVTIFFHWKNNLTKIFGISVKKLVFIEENICAFSKLVTIFFLVRIVFVKSLGSV